MSNEAQYINPIIEAMARTAQSKQYYAGLKQQADQFKQEEALREQQQAAHEKQIEYEHQQHQDMLEKYHLPMLQSQLQLARLNAIEHVRQSLASGVAPSAYQTAPVNIPGGTPTGVGGTMPDITKPGTPPGMLSMPVTGENIPISAFPTPQQNLQNEANRAKTLAGAQAEGALPFQLELAKQHFTNSKALQDSAEAFQSKTQDKAIEANKLKDQFDKQTQLQIAGMTLGSHERIAQMEHGITPQQQQSGIIQAMTGMRKFSSDNIYDRNIMQAVQEAGGRPLDPKEADTLKQLNGLGTTFDKMQGFIDKHLPSESEGVLSAGSKAVWQGIMAKSGLPTDVKTDFDTIKSDALRIGRGLEGFTGGRVLAKQLELDMNSLVGPGMTKEQAIRKLNALKDQYVNQEQNVIMGGMPDVQKNLIMQQYKVKQPSTTGTLPMGQTPPGIPVPSGSIRWTRDPQGNPIPMPPQPPAGVPQRPQ